MLAPDAAMKHFLRGIRMTHATQAPVIKPPPSKQRPGQRRLVTNERCQHQARPQVHTQTSHVSESSVSGEGPELSAAKPWTAQDLELLSRLIRENDADDLGNRWRDMFIHNPVEILFKYGFSEATLARVESGEVVDSVSITNAGQWNEMMGLGTWRLREYVNGDIAFVLQRIEGTWRELFEEDLSLYPRERWKHYDICDSQDPARELDGWSYADIPSPNDEEEGYPRLLLENRVYSTNVFRKLHVEFGARQDGLQVLHCVLYPRYAYDLPILALDMVIVDGRVTLGIIDACPVSTDLSLPSYYQETMEELQQVFLGSEMMKQRRIPDWGKRIFSPCCVCVTPDTFDQLARFLAYATALHRAHCMLATLARPLSRREPANRAKLQELLDAQKRFVDNQLENKKTSRVLEAAFGKEWSDTYMRSMMFDFSPGEEPPVEKDSAVVRLYKYFRENPSLGDSGEEIAALEWQVATDRAHEVLERMALGEAVRQDKAEQALLALFLLDEEFQKDCLMAMPGLLALPAPQVGAELLQRFEEVGFGTAIPRWTGNNNNEVRQLTESAATEARPADQDSKSKQS